MDARMQTVIMLLAFVLVFLWMSLLPIIFLQPSPSSSQQAASHISETVFSSEFQPGSPFFSFLLFLTIILRFGFGILVVIWARRK